MTSSALNRRSAGLETSGGHLRWGSLRTLQSAAAVLLSLAVGVESARAHGTILEPQSRVYKCRFADNPENPQDPACAAAVEFAGDPQFLYDWSAIRQGDADGQHQQVVPDGQLCSGGDPVFAGLDLPRDDWRATAIHADADGTYEFIYRASAPHATQDMLFFVTPEGWDPTAPLAWGDLDFDPTDSDIDPFCELGSVPLETLPQIGPAYRMRCPLPQRTGRHVIYQVWQRSDSPEAFYACVDVILSSSPPLFADDFESGDVGAWTASFP
ncbi:MAG: lytic polysaccharide monooxygenase [Acidobacteriota bacterium]